MEYGRLGPADPGGSSRRSTTPLTKLPISSSSATSKRKLIIVSILAAVLIVAAAISAVLVTVVRSRASSNIPNLQQDTFPRLMHQLPRRLPRLHHCLGARPCPHLIQHDPPPRQQGVFRLVRPLLRCHRTQSSGGVRRLPRAIGGVNGSSFPIPRLHPLAFRYIRQRRVETWL
ncbi:hypothetical protein V8G54_037590 [Vigna mungo]|uniref:Uncharacterized protein n=1 Tax=Vigna mungo TaxID=3915 RepID=A0AAQ3MJF4_VIGMU